MKSSAHVIARGIAPKQSSTQNTKARQAPLIAAALERLAMTLRDYSGGDGDEDRSGFSARGINLVAMRHHDTTKRTLSKRPGIAVL
jgi:hypothetical protein